MSDESRPSYMAKCPGCNHVIAATVDDPKYRTDVAKEVAEWIADGLIVERGTVGQVRRLFDLCACSPVQAETLPLFSGAHPC